MNDISRSIKNDILKNTKEKDQTDIDIKELFTY